ncbi:u3 small nucleolar RNA-associated protein [Anaeramoeba ignava]|uniref:U3 small nucleolar RNA-associated protein n=1 Tax=Anaeramoeba ignava TaxID=1746090 RepID=A0A9Q0LVD4_ANAIG|nr:u3 small nucleolar RNA-associated protein [Anaeramoeba ignava]|eukprot:Anaeramoba_ignava/a485746_65.p1 GENE.a485746_65~~a485746_65.p1  ORF type:complete len:435 (+),score=96.44 a485746_65:48-1352(+)
MKGLTPKWRDEEDEKKEIQTIKKTKEGKRKHRREQRLTGEDLQKRLRNHFEKTHKTTNWAVIDLEKEDEKRNTKDEQKTVDFDITKRTKPIVVNTGELAKGTIDLSRLKDANIQERTYKPVTSLQFHKNSELLLVSGLDSRFRLFRVDGISNEKLQTVHLPKYPIISCAFSGDTQVVCSGKRSWFFTYDLVSESIEKIPFISGYEHSTLERMIVSPDEKYLCFMTDSGNILVVSNQTKKLIQTLKMNVDFADQKNIYHGVSNGRAGASFFNDSRNLLTVGEGGFVYIWDIRNFSCIHKHSDMGTVVPSSIVGSSSSSYYAVGSNSGIVNLYDASTSVLSESPAPVKSFMNLTTSITAMQFNPDSNILAISSSLRNSQIRFVHIPSLSVFHNWPSQKSPVKMITSLAFSPHGGYFVCGSIKGRVLLYRVNHYEKA